MTWQWKHVQTPLVTLVFTTSETRIQPQIRVLCMRTAVVLLLAQRPVHMLHMDFAQGAHVVEILHAVSLQYDSANMKCYVLIFLVQVLGASVSQWHIVDEVVVFRKLENFSTARLNGAVLFMS
uniref:Secreted protein n=1 Tax=Ascaris lumbricoides TaxID=6252 RepID=A0A0M3HVQ3_ASCLU